MHPSRTASTGKDELLEAPFNVKHTHSAHHCKIGGQLRSFKVPIVACEGGSAETGQGEFILCLKDADLAKVQKHMLRIKA